MNSPPQPSSLFHKEEGVMHYIGYFPPPYEVERRTTVKKLPYRQFHGGARLKGWIKGVSS